MQTSCHCSSILISAKGVRIPLSPHDINITIARLEDHAQQVRHFTDQHRFGNRVVDPRVEISLSVNRFVFTKLR